MSSSRADTDRLVAAKQDVKGRIFVMEILKLTNGCFASISEDQAPRMGTITVSVKKERRSVQSSQLIPDSRGAMLANMVGEILAEQLGGIVVISLYLREEIEAETMKTLISEVRRLVRKDPV